MSFEKICSICAWSYPFLWRLIISVLPECAVQIYSGRDKVRITLIVLVNNAVSEHWNKNLSAEQVNHMIDTD